MKQETIEVSARKWAFETNGHKWSNNDNTAGDNYGSFIAGAKFVAEKSYSKEEVIELLEHVRENFYDTGSKWHLQPDTDYTSKEVVEKYLKKKL